MMDSESEDQMLLLKVLFFPAEEMEFMLQEVEVILEDQDYMSVMSS